jgi:hypothetical protein
MSFSRNGCWLPFVDILEGGIPPSHPVSWPKNAGLSLWLIEDKSYYVGTPKLDSLARVMEENSFSAQKHDNYCSLGLQNHLCRLSVRSIEQNLAFRMNPKLMHMNKNGACPRERA